MAKIRAEGSEEEGGGIERKGRKGTRRNTWTTVKTNERSWFLRYLNNCKNQWKIVIFAFFLYVLLRGSEKPCFFIVFYNKVLKKSSFLAFFGKRLSVDLGPHGVMPSEIWSTVKNRKMKIIQNIKTRQSKWNREGGPPPWWWALSNLQYALVVMAATYGNPCPTWLECTAWSHKPGKLAATSTWPPLRSKFTVTWFQALNERE